MVATYLMLIRLLVLLQALCLGLKMALLMKKRELSPMNTVSDVEMELDDIFGQDSQLIFLDTDLDFDLDILVAENYADNNVAFYLRLNESND